MEMDDVKSDPRFAHIDSDPRFRPMPKSKQKLKIDSRFQSLFTNRHFSHRTDMDKRGRPIIDTSKRNKHAMERFYELSESDSNESEDSTEKNVTVTPKQMKAKVQAEHNGSQVSHASRSRTKITSDNADTNKRRAFMNDDAPPLKKKRRQNMLSDLKSQENVRSIKAVDVDDTDNVACRKKDGDHAEDLEERMNSGSDESESNSEEDEENELLQYTEDYAIEETEVDHKWNELQNDAVEITESTSRLAVCNMDWDFVKAQDLFILFKSFVPEGGRVKSVTIYPSPFGKERMAEEAMLGPKEIREQTNELSDLGGESTGKKGQKGKATNSLRQSEKEKTAAQVEKLREYQLNRLRYYYAVVDCDSVRTADTIYGECDGREYQLSSVRVDLRFIPDDRTFTEDPKDSYSEEQNILEYKPQNFISSALCQAKVDVTWDETEFDRLHRHIGMLQQKQLASIVEENKYSYIIAPPESDSEGEDERPEWLKTVLAENDGDDETELSEERKIQMYRQILIDKIAEEEEEREKEEHDFDKEVEWQPGLKSTLVEKMKKKEKRKTESNVVNEYLEKKKDKKKKKKKMKLQKEAEDTNKEGELAFSDDEVPDGFDKEELRQMMEEESEGKKKKKKKKKKKVSIGEDLETVEDNQVKAELELMVMGETGEQQSDRLETLNGVDGDSKKTKRKGKRAMAKLKKKTKLEKEDSVLDLEEDSRFSALFTSHHFHIDPNAPQFKASKNMRKLVDEQIKRKDKKVKKKGKEEFDGGSGSDVQGVTHSRKVSQSLVESLKRKMKKKS